MMTFPRPTPLRGSLKTLLGGFLLLTGIALMVFGLPDFSSNTLHYDKLADMKASDAGFPTLKGAFPVERISRYRMGRENSGLELTVAHYQAASAIVFPPATNNPRHDLWQATAEAIEKHTEQAALFLSWWDNSQRLHFLTGRTPWLNQPIAAAFPDAQEQKFWQHVSGGFASDEKLRQLARWLTMDADTALTEMEQALPKGQAVYWLACLDDLARLQEIETLSGVKLPFEARVFPAASDIHAQITEVQRWAGENGINAYLVQALPNGGTRAWRITREEGTKTLLARLLPFTTSLAKPLDKLSLVYQSPWGGYLSVYEWRR